MITDLTIPGINLTDLVVAVEEAEDEHRQIIPLREDMRHVPVGCACGLGYSSNDPMGGARRHMQEVRAHAVVQALHRPCDSCLGTGTWTKMRGTFECADCEGRGRTLTPLGRNRFFDEDDRTWTVQGIEDVEEGWGRAWVQVE